MKRNRKLNKIEISVRIRPLTDSESVLDINESTGSLKVNHTYHEFPDHLITGSDQKKAFRSSASRLLEKIQEGYSCCMMAYGQTGSGKHTCRFLL